MVIFGGSWILIVLKRHIDTKERSCCLGFAVLKISCYVYRPIPLMLSFINLLVQGRERNGDKSISIPRASDSWI